MADLDEIKKELEETFPEMTFHPGKRFYGKCIIARLSKYSGADIFVKDDIITVQAGIPEMKTRMLIGSGALFLKMFRKSYSEPALKIKSYLDKKYSNVKMRD